jgi:hypothetical protein
LEFEMSISDKVTDWEITHIAQVGGAATVGGGVYFCWGIAVAGGVSVGAGIGAGTFAAKRTNASGVEEVLFLAAEAGGQSGVALGGSSLVGRWCYVDRFIDDYIAQPITSAGRWMQDVVQSALD